MRQRKKELIITFHTTAQAMKMEKLAISKQKKGRLIPLPAQVSAGCGLAFMVSEGTEESWRDFCHNEAIEFADVCEVWL